VLRMDQPLLGLPGLGQPLLIHMAHSSEALRHNARDSGLPASRDAPSVNPQARDAGGARR
jgi:hypothetical protein